MEQGPMSHSFLGQKSPRTLALPLVFRLVQPFFSIFFSFTFPFPPFAIVTTGT
jgi:hypothetical protein